MKTKTFSGSEKALIIGIIFTVAVVIACIAMLGMVTPPGTPPKGNETEKEVNYSNFTALLEDFDDLPEIKDGVDLKERNAKERILFLLRGDDPEIERAFEVLQKYGRPSNFTYYEFPAYNTQLEVLLWLAEEREISDYDRIALAIALNYGAVLAISDEEVEKELKDYVVNLYDYFVETDAIVPWDIMAYPLEADIALVWGANGINYPLFFEKVGQYPEGATFYRVLTTTDYYYLDWIDIFKDKRMSKEDFDWLFVDVGTLREIREFLMHDMFSPGFEEVGVKGIANEIDSMLTHSLEHYTYYPWTKISYVEVEGRITPGCALSNPDWQWKHFKEKRRIMGNCADVSSTNTFFLKSINLPAFVIGVHSGSFWHRVVVFYDYEKDLWRITEHQKEIIEGHVEAPKLSVDNYFPVVWSNWHEKIYPGYSYEELRTLEEGFEIHEV